MDNASTNTDRSIMKYNTITGQVSETVPAGIYEGIDYHGAPPADVAARAGWVDVTPEIQAIIDAAEAQRQAEAAAARIASFQPLIPVASLYRATLRKHFGDNAETNHDVTKSSVSAYFEQKRMAGTITAVETADALALSMYFDILADWNGTGETWTLPYQVVP